MIARGQVQGSLLTQAELNDTSDKRWTVPKNLGDNLVTHKKDIYYFFQVFSSG